jgi:NTP pyrophosphatase (non-canonical NTP hydrolase)
MDTKLIEKTVLNFCKKHEWKLDPNKDLRAVMEEFGEVCREVRRYEDGRERPDEIEVTKNKIKEDLAEEVGDMLFPLVKLLSYFGLTLEDAFQNHVNKMERRYGREGEKDG